MKASSQHSGLGPSLEGWQCSSHCLFLRLRSLQVDFHSQWEQCDHCVKPLQIPCPHAATSPTIVEARSCLHWYSVSTYACSFHRQHEAGEISQLRIRSWLTTP